MMKKNIEEINTIDTENYFETAETILSPENFFLEIGNENKFNELLEISLELFSPKKEGNSFFEQILLKVKKNIIDVYDEQIMFLVFGSDLKMSEIFDKKLKIFWKEIRKEIKMIVKNGIENIKNSLSEFIYKFYFEKMFFPFNDEKNIILRRNIHILLIYLDKSNEYSSLFLIDFLYKLLEIYGEDFNYEWEFYLNILFKLKDNDLFKEKKELFVSLIDKLIRKNNVGLLLFYDNCFRFINYDDIFHSLNKELIKFDIFLNYDNIHYFRKFIEFYKKRIQNEKNNDFFVSVFLKLLDMIILIYFNNFKIKNCSNIENIIINVLNSLKIQKLIWYKKLFGILYLTKNISEDSLFYLILKEFENPSDEEINFIYLLIKKCNKKKLLEKLKIIIDYISSKKYLLFKFLISTDLYIDKEQFLYLSKKDLNNKEYISYLKLSSKNENNNENIIYLNINKESLEDFNFQNIQYIKFLRNQFQFIFFFKNINYVHLIFKIESSCKLNKKISKEFIKILSSIIFTLDSQKIEKYNNKEINLKNKIYDNIIEQIKNVIGNEDNNSIEHNKDKNHIRIFKLKELISLLEFYIYSLEEFDKNKLENLLELFQKMRKSDDLINFLILRFFFINQNQIIKQLNQFDLKIVIQIIDLIEKIVDFSNKKENAISKNYILIDDNCVYEENEENKNNKLVNYYLKIFKEIIFISFCNNDIFKKEIFKKLKEKENYFLFKLSQKNLSTENPRYIISKNKENNNNSLFYNFNKGLFEIVKNEKDDLNIIIRKPLFDIQLNIKQDFSNDKIIIKDDKKKLDLLNIIYNKEEDIENEENFSYEKNNNIENFLQIISDYKISNIIELKDKNKIDLLNKLSVYYSFSSTVVYLQKKEIYNKNYIFDLKKEEISHNFILFINSLGRLLYKENNLIIMNYKDSIIDFNFECYIPINGEDNIEKNEEDFINDEKYLNKNNNLSCIVFLENPFFEINENLLKKFEKFKIVFFIFPISNQYHLIKIYQFKKINNFLNDYIIYIKDSYKLLSNYLIKTLISLNIYNNIQENIPIQNNQNLIETKISKRKEYIYK